nr:MAG TPA: hypothetical protein [Caudoviricetes sp.]
MYINFVENFYLCRVWLNLRKLNVNAQKLWLRKK